MQLSDEDRSKRDKEMAELEQARKVQAETDKMRFAAMEKLRSCHALCIGFNVAICVCECVCVCARRHHAQAQVMC
jgi:hypothetical protein